MRFNLLHVVAAAVCLGQAVRANDIEAGKDKYSAVPLPKAFKLDGKLDEWAGVPVLADPKFAIPKGSAASGTYVLFEEYSGGKWTGPDDQTSAVQVAYDADNVYFGFVVTDDYHENAANSAWNGDSVQLMIASADRTAQVALYNYALGGIEGETGDVIVMHEATPPDIGDAVTEAVITRDAATKRTTYEIKLPKATLGLTELKAGVKFGLGMAINDGDLDTPGQRGWGGLGAHAIVFGKTPGETAEVTLASNEPKIEILGVGTESLLGGDLTDPENDGDEAAGPTDASWNWASINSNIEPAFEGGEFSFNIFDNKLGPGNDKWCCDDPSDSNPYWVAVEFKNPVSLTHFTISSANDTPNRDPLHFQIQGSNDGQSYTPIYTRNSEDDLWTDRLQVIKFTLPTPAPLYRFLRYYVTYTLGDLHQLGEIEYFGNVGTADKAFLSAINPQLDTFTFRANDAGASVVNTSGQLVLDGTAIALTGVRSGSAVDFAYTPAKPFASASEHTYTIIVKDALGNSITSEGTFKTQTYANLAATDKVTADTSKPGFLWRVHQNNSLQATDNTRPLLQLAGLLGQNFADASAQGVAIATGTAGANNTLPIEFEIAGTLNLSQTGGDANGDFTPDDQMPGIPGAGSGDGLDGIAGDVITYIDLPAGKTTLIVNSDDGFRTTAGAINDIFKGQLAGEFNGGRGAADTAFTVFAETAGVYAVRTVWQEGGGGANIEIKSVKADGTKALVNDTANGGLKSYRKLTGAGLGGGVSLVAPLPGATGVALDATLTAIIQEGATPVDVTSVKLSLGGTDLPATATKSGSTITITYKPTAFYAAGSVQTAGISYTSGGTTRKETWTFTVENYATLTKSQQATSVDKSKPGFLFRAFQNEAVQQTSLAQTELALAGNLLNAGAKLDNLIDASVTGPALAAGVVDGPLVKFEIATVINLSQAGGESNGNFPDDEQMPGIPGTSGSTDGIDAEIITFVELPAGLITMGVNSDDGFRTQAGYIGKPADGAILGQFDGGRGASDTTYKFVVQDAGIYGFRTIWQEGGGGANIEWFSVKSDGTKVLLNDSANGGLKAYRVGTAPSKPSEYSIGVSRVDGKASITWTESGAVLQSSGDLKTWTDVAGAASPYSPTSTAAGGTFYRLKK